MEYLNFDVNIFNFNTVKNSNPSISAITTSDFHSTVSRVSASLSLADSPYPSEMVKDTVGDLNTDSFVKLLSKLIGESQYVQNNPPDLIPQEDRIVRHVLDALLPYSTQTGGGPLIVNHVTYFPGRGNVIVEYPGTVPGKILSFVGMHMDVVTANPNDWVCCFYPLFLFSIWFLKLGFGGFGFLICVCVCVCLVGEEMGEGKENRE